MQCCVVQGDGTDCLYSHAKHDELCLHGVLEALQVGKFRCTRNTCRFDHTSIDQLQPSELQIMGSYALSVLDSSSLITSSPRAGQALHEGPLQQQRSRPTGTPPAASLSKSDSSTREGTSPRSAASAGRAGRQYYQSRALNAFSPRASQAPQEPLQRQRSLLNVTPPAANANNLRQPNSTNAGRSALMTASGGRAGQQGIPHMAASGGHARQQYSPSVAAFAGRAAQHSPSVVASGDRAAQQCSPLILASGGRPGQLYSPHMAASRGRAGQPHSPSVAASGGHAGQQNFPQLVASAGHAGQQYNQNPLTPSRKKQLERLERRDALIV